MRKRFSKPRWFSAQSASELAIFGAIVMFVIGSLVKMGMSMSQRTNTQLRAFRLALLESYRTSEGAYGDIIAARNSASIMILEDRLSVDPGSKQGTSNRVPFLAQGSGTFSKNMLYPKDMGEKSNYPFYDVFINGQRFPFIMADFITITFRVNAGQPQIVRSRNSRVIDVIDLPYCETVTHPQPCWNRIGGFPVFFRKNYNYPANEDWCSAGCTNLSADWRFDLDIDGDLTDNGDGYVPDNILFGATRLRARFLWQWVAVAVHTPEAAPLLSVTFGSGPGSVTIPAGGLFPAGEGVRIDVDLDFQDETIHTLTVGVNPASPTGAPIIVLKVMDTQEGEIDFSWDGRNDALLNVESTWWTNNCCPPGSLPGCVPAATCSLSIPKKPEIGLAKDVRMYSFTKDGTYLRLEEGKLINAATGQVIRSTSKRDHIDIIERVFSLSNDTDRFCDASGHRVVWGTSPYAYAEGLYGLTNPVEACNNCFTQGNVRNTCFDENTKILYIRSRLDDLRGRKWQTIFK